MIQSILKITRIVSGTMDVTEKLIRLDKEKSLSILLSKVGGKLIALSIQSSKKAVARVRLSHKFSMHIIRMYKYHGDVFVIKYLKASQLAISKFLAGQPLTSLRELEPDLNLPRLKRSGLPNVIGTRDSRSLHAFSHKTVRLGLTLFSIYRVISIPCRSKLETITDTFSGNKNSLEIVDKGMEIRSSALLQRFLKDLKFRPQNRFVMDEKASATNSNSGVGMLTDLSILKSSSIFPSVLGLAQKNLNGPMLKYMNNILEHLPERSSSGFDQLPMKKSFRSNKDRLDLGLGQLAQKEEAAGKMRTFAMVDSGTQNIMMPLHVYLSDLLKKIPNDGTSSHLDAFDRVRTRSLQYGCSYGYDLSAATDRLPLSLQKTIINSLLGSEYGDHGAKVLVGRPYYLINKEVQSYTYSVGQPMGARSSFTMLGLCHHLLVQFASNRLDNTGEDRYEIVGDDIVIFDRQLALSYLKVMNSIGVPINESKSIVSTDRPVAEYVKRVSLNGIDVSPYSGKQFGSQDTYLGRISSTIGLILKDPSLIKRAISILHIVLGNRLGDPVPKTDHTALLYLYVVYALKCDMPLSALVKVYLSLGPEIQDKNIKFTSFPISVMSSRTLDLMRGKLPDVTGMPLFKEICNRLNKVNVLKIKRISSIYTEDRYSVALDNIVNSLLGSLQNDELKKAVKQLVCYSSPVIRDNEGRLEYSLTDLSKVRSIKLDEGYESRYGSAMDYYKILEELQNVISFLDLPKRLKEFQKEQILDKDIKNAKVLCDIIEAHRMVLKEVPTLK